MEALSFGNIIDHVVLQKLVDVVGTDLAKTITVDSLEGSPRFKSGLFRQLLALFFDYFFVLRNCLQEEVDFVTS